MFDFLDKMFDMNHDGKLGPLETSMKWATIAGVMDECTKQNDVDSSFDVDLSFSGVTDDQRDELEMAGLDPFELEWMDEEERREAMEGVGLDPDDYDFM
ncbi:MAG: hypothetical protein LIO96_15120 [Lachnospiraceae bacterium]|nr:hypothetical protein [Lachnospiraceae bacterium]